MKMTRNSILLLVILGGLSSIITATGIGAVNSLVNWQSSEVSLRQKAERLRKLADEVQISIPDLRDSKEREFFDEFPNDFQSFLDLYGYTEAQDTGLLQDVADLHRAVFRSLRSIPSDEYFTKLINISAKGIWQEDAISLFHEFLVDTVAKNLRLTCRLLAGKKPEEIGGFWYFYFDSPHPPRKLPSELEQTKSLDKGIYQLMKRALRRVQMDERRLN